MPVSFAGPVTNTGAVLVRGLLMFVTEDRKLCRPVLLDGKVLPEQDMIHFQDQK